MTGAPWSTADIGIGRPGLFINFVPQAVQSVAAGQRGVYASPVKAPWGPDEVVQAINNESELERYYTRIDTPGTYNAWFTGHNAFLGGARQLLLYRLEGSGAAKATHTFQDTAGSPANALVITGRYNGARGNAFKVTLQANAEDATKTDFILYELLADSSLAELSMWTSSTTARGDVGHIQELVDLINSDVNNYWIVATLANSGGNDTPASVSQTSLSGGNDGSAPIAGDYTAALAAFQVLNFNVFSADVIDGEVAGISASIKTWVQSMRSNGKRIVWITGGAINESISTAESNAEGYNAEYVVYVHPGIKQINSAGVLTSYRGAAAAAQIAGKIAGLELGLGLTNQTLLEVQDVTLRYDGVTIDGAIESGVLILDFDGQNFVTQEGCNTLTTLDETKQNEAWQNIGTINTMDAIATALNASARANYVGKVRNDKEGQDALLSVIRDFLRRMSSDRAIDSDFTVALSQAFPSTGKKVFIDLFIRPIATMDYIYLTITVGA